MDQDRWKVAGGGEDSEAPSHTSSGGCDPCANNCGFLGTLFRMNYCSTCYAEIVLRAKHPLPLISAQANPHSSLLLSSSTLSPSPLSLSSSVLLLSELVSGSTKSSASRGAISLHSVCKPRVPKTSPATPSENMSPPADEAQTASASNYAKTVASPPLSRCSSCHKRVRMNGFNCRCGLLFCALHRYPDKHLCPFDYKAAGRVAIARANPIVKAEKMNKI